MPNVPSSCLLRKRAVAESISAVATATVLASTSVRIVASINSRTDRVSGS